jgi:hypothetical protein
VKLACLRVSSGADCCFWPRTSSISTQEIRGRSSTPLNSS